MAKLKKRKPGFAKGMISERDVKKLLDPALDRELERLFYNGALWPVTTIATHSTASSSRKPSSKVSPS